MQLLSLQVQNLRVLRDVSLDLSPALNVVVGPNGSGKTSILEAVHVLGLVRSFRASGLGEVVRRGEDMLRVHGKYVDERSHPGHVGVEWGENGRRIRLDGKDIRSAAALAGRLPLLVFSPESYRVLTDGAVYRRRLMDWAVFHVEPTAAEMFSRYRRALKQRNALLREDGGGSGLDAWDREVAEWGETLDGLRRRYAEEVSRRVGEYCQGLLGMEVSMSYRRGWMEGEGLAEVLARRRERDRQRGFTGRGPHAADLSFGTEGAAARLVLSRGEGKLFVAALLLGHLAYLGEKTGQKALVLVDDLASELDAGSRSRFLEKLRATGCQTLVTAVAPALVPVEGWREHRLFHVEQGGVTEMV